MSEAVVDYTAGALGSWQRLRPNTDITAFVIGMRIRRAATVMTQALAHIVTEIGFAGFGDYQLAAEVRTAGALQPSDIAARLMLTRAGVTGRLDRLEHDGLVVRSVSRKDARVIEVRLTPRGRRRVDAAFDRIARYQVAVLEPLDGVEQVQLAELLQRVLAPHDEPVSRPNR